MPVLAPVSRNLPRTVKYGSSISSMYCSGGISVATPAAQSCGSCLPAPITPAGGLHPARGRNPVPDPAIQGWELRGGGHSSSGGAPAPATARPAPPQRSTGGSSGPSLAGGAAGGGGGGSSPPRWGGGPSSHHRGGPPRARGAADLKHTCDCPRCVVHYETCIQALTAQVRDLQTQNQELQRSNRELSQAVAAVTGISQSYWDRMSQILSTLAKQEEVVRGYQRESRGVADSVVDHLKMSNSNTAKCLSAVETLAARCAALASRLDEWDRWYATSTEPAASVLQPPSTAPPVSEPHLTAPSCPWARHLVHPVVDVPFLFPATHRVTAPTIRTLVWTLGGRGGRGNSRHTLTKRSQQLLRGGKPRISKKKPLSPNGGRCLGVNDPPWSLRLLIPVRRGRSTSSPTIF